MLKPHKPGVKTVNFLCVFTAVRRASSPAADRPGRKAARTQVPLPPCSGGPPPLPRSGRPSCPVRQTGPGRGNVIGPAIVMKLTQILKIFRCSFYAVSLEYQVSMCHAFRNHTRRPRGRGHAMPRRAGAGVRFGVDAGKGNTHRVHGVIRAWCKRKELQLWN